MSGTLAKTHRQTDEVMATICQALRSGLPLDRAFRSGGISKSTGHAWRQSGWRQIEMADANTSDELSYVARFAIAVDAALIEFMQPLVKRFADGALGGNKGDWRAARELLAARLPHEFSERVAVAQSQKMEISGGIDHSHYSVQLAAMTLQELRDESERHDAVIYAGLGGPSLDREIEKLERQLVELCKSRDRERDIELRPRGKFSTGPAGSLTRRAPFDLTALEVTGATEFDHEPNEVLAAVLQAPDEAEGSGVVARPSATPSETAPVSFVVPDAPARGIGFNKFGDAINLADEDTTL